jgi:hypothetical protein
MTKWSYCPLPEVLPLHKCLINLILCCKKWIKGQTILAAKLPPAAATKFRIYQEQPCGDKETLQQALENQVLRTEGVSLRKKMCEVGQKLSVNVGDAGKMNGCGHSVVPNLL